MPFDLQGKVALVTGSARGFGRFFCYALAEAGAEVICVARGPQEETLRLVDQFGHRSLPLVVDVSKTTDIDYMADQIAREFGKLDIAVNNAGMIHKPYRFHEIPREDWERLISVDLTGVFLCMQKELHLMVKQKSGVIINISSILGLTGLVPQLMPRASYIAAKHAVIGLTKQAALEYAQDGIRVNAIAPGWFGGTDLARHRLEGKPAEEFQERERKIAEFTPMGRRGDVEELKGLLLYLASDTSSFVTGQTFAIDGGWTAL